MGFGAPWVQTLEGRLFFSSVVGPEIAADVGAATAGVVDAAAAAADPDRPSVGAVFPEDGNTDIRRDVFVSVDVRLAGPGLNIDTVDRETVLLYQTDLGRTKGLVPASVNTSGAGDSISLTPFNQLATNTQYTFVVTDDVTDDNGATFVPFTMTFKTGTLPDRVPDYRFTKVPLPDTAVPMPNVPVPPPTGNRSPAYTALTIGPDGKLYAGTVDGWIVRHTINPDGTLGPREAIDTLRTHAGNDKGNRLLAGFAFDPVAAATGDLVLWVVHGDFVLGGYTDRGSKEKAEAWSSRLTRLSGPDLATAEDRVVNLPRSARDHTSNQPVFGPDGAIYIGQPAHTSQGLPDDAWLGRAESLLSATILRVDPARLPADRPLNVKTADGGNYNPFAPGAAVTIYASGVRNAFDLVWTTDGRLFSPVNGSNFGGSAPASPAVPDPDSVRIDGDDDGDPTNGMYAGPAVPGLDPVRVSQNDYLWRIETGGYYGHPNPHRSEFALQGGNPTDGEDPAEVTQYPVGTLPDRNWRPPIFDFGDSVSPNGAIEYRSTAFKGTLRGRLMVTRFSGGDDIAVLTRDAGGKGGGIALGETGVEGLSGFDDPLDLVEDPNTGNLYIAEYTGARITLARPNVPPGPPPEAALDATDVSAVVAGSLTFPVVYTDADDAIDVETLDDRDVLVTGPGGVSRFATFAGLAGDESGNGNPRTALYRLADDDADGRWNAADNGGYQVRLVDDAVSDTAGNPAAARVLDSFQVAVPVQQLVVAVSNPPALAHGTAEVVQELTLVRADLRVTNDSDVWLGVRATHSEGPERIGPGDGTAGEMAGVGLVNPGGDVEYATTFNQAGQTATVELTASGPTALAANLIDVLLQRLGVTNSAPERVGVAARNVSDLPAITAAADRLSTLPDPGPRRVKAIAKAAKDLRKAVTSAGQAARLRDALSGAGLDVPAGPGFKTALKAADVKTLLRRIVDAPGSTLGENGEPIVVAFRADPR